MVYTRYDHRKLAFQYRKKRKKKSDLLSDDEWNAKNQNNFSKERRRATFDGLNRVHFDVGDGDSPDLLEHHNDQSKQYVNPNLANAIVNERKSQRKNRRQNAQKRRKRSGASGIRFNEENLAATQSGDPRSSLSQNPGEDDCLESISRQLTEQAQNLESNKLEEEFKEIKHRLRDIVGNYKNKGKAGTYSRPVSVCSSFNSSDSFGGRSRPTSSRPSPLFLSSASSGEESDAESNNRNNIFTVLERHSLLCTERENVLKDLQDCLDESSCGKIQDETSEEMNLANNIKKLDEFLAKPFQLKKMHDKLIRMATRDRDGNANMVEEVRTTMIQKDVVKHFKKLREAKISQQEAADEWTSATEEIVQLLQAVRKEGSTDVERLENEFNKLVDAFAAQGKLTEGIRTRLEAQDQILAQTNSEMTKVKKENEGLQESIDSCRHKIKTASMKCDTLEGKVKQKMKMQKANDGDKLDEEKDKIKLKMARLEVEIAKYKEKVEESEEESPPVGVMEGTEDLPKTDDITCNECSASDQRIFELKKIEMEDEEEIARLKKTIQDLENNRNTDNVSSFQISEPGSTMEYPSTPQYRRTNLPHDKTKSVRDNWTETILCDPENIPVCNCNEEIGSRESPKSRWEPGSRENLETPESRERPTSRVKASSREMFSRLDDEGNPTDELSEYEMDEEFNDLNDNLLEYAAHIGELVTKEKTETTSVIPQDSFYDDDCFHENDFKPEPKSFSFSRSRRSSIIDQIYNSNSQSRRRSSVIPEPGVSIRRLDNINENQMILPVTEGQEKRKSRIRKPSISFPIESTIHEDSEEPPEGVSNEESGIFVDSFEGMDNSVVGKNDRAISYLNNAGKRKCSYVAHHLDILSDLPEASKEELKVTINVFSSHALQLIKIVLFALKKLDDCEIADISVKQFRAEIIAKVKKIWGPVQNKIIHKQQSKISNHDDENHVISRDVSRVIEIDSGFREEDGGSGAIIPRGGDIQEEDEPDNNTLTAPSNSPLGRSASKIRISLMECEPQKALAEEKKRMKILERQKKLVDRLKVGGASTKQIYRILGISGKTHTGILNDIIPPVINEPKRGRRSVNNAKTNVLANVMTMQNPALPLPVNMAVKTQLPPIHLARNDMMVSQTRNDMMKSPISEIRTGLPPIKNMTRMIDQSHLPRNRPPPQQGLRGVPQGHNKGLPGIANVPIGLPSIPQGKNPISNNRRGNNIRGMEEGVVLPALPAGNRNYSTAMTKQLHMLHFLKGRPKNDRRPYRR